MNNLIERYVQEVIKRLPENEREDVYKELMANIYDMLSENPSDAEVKRVLEELGAPAKLAEQYRQNPQYLISPAIYSTYIHTLRWVVPLVATILVIVGILFGAIETISTNSVTWDEIIGSCIGEGISMGISGALQAVIWTTVGFVIAERTNNTALVQQKKKWTVEDLPEVHTAAKKSIPLSDSIVELVLVTVFTVLTVLCCSNMFPVAFMIQTGDTVVHSVFSDSFLTACIPAVTVMAAFSIFEAVAKIKDQRWTLLVCITTIVSNLMSMALFLYLIYRPDIFSGEFMSFIQSQQWGSHDLLRLIQTGNINWIIFALTFIIVAANIATCGSAIYKTLKENTKKRQEPTDQPTFI